MRHFTAAAIQLRRYLLTSTHQTAVLSKEVIDCCDPTFGGKVKIELDFEEWGEFGHDYNKTRDFHETYFFTLISYTSVLSIISL